MIIYYTPSAGDTIQHAAETAVKKAYDSLHTVHFAFNGITLVAKPSLTHSQDADRIVTEYFQALTKSAHIYRESPEGVQEQQDSQTRVTTAQTKIDDLFARLADIPEDGLPQLLDWLVEYAEAADVRGVNSYRWHLSQLLEGAGFARNAYLGRSKQEYQNREFLGGWIIGQAIDKLIRDLPTHDSLARHVQTFHKLPHQTPPMNHPTTNRNAFNITRTVTQGPRIFSPIAGLVSVHVSRQFENAAREALAELQNVRTDDLAQNGHGELATLISRARVAFYKACRDETANHEHAMSEAFGSHGQG